MKLRYVGVDCKQAIDYKAIISAHLASGKVPDKLVDEVMRLQSDLYENMSNDQINFSVKKEFQ